MTRVVLPPFAVSFRQACNFLEGRAKLGAWGGSEHVQPAVAGALGDFDPFAETEKLPLEPAWLHPVDRGAKVADQLFEFKAAYRHNFNLCARAALA